MESNVQNIYWTKMCIYKYNFFYLNEYFMSSVKVDRIIKIFSTVASSAAIACWAKWNSMDFLWGLVIVLSQVVMTVNEILPYKKRIETLSAMLAQSSALYLDVERKWHSVASGDLTAEEINELTYDFAKRWNEIDSKYFEDDGLAVKSKFKEIAERRVEDYFKANFMEE